MDKGQVAKWVSNASFATLTLIFSFTQLLDLGSQFSTLAGVTLRVGQLLQVLPSLLASSTAFHSISIYECWSGVEPTCAIPALAAVFCN